MNAYLIVLLWLIGFCAVLCYAFILYVGAVFFGFVFPKSAVLILMALTVIVSYIAMWKNARYGIKSRRFALAFFVFIGAIMVSVIGTIILDIILKVFGYMVMSFDLS